MELKEEQTEEKQEKKEKKGNELFKQMRGLLNDYPREIILGGCNNILDYANNLVLINDLLIYCKYKSLSDDIKKELQKEIDILNQFDIYGIKLNLKNFNTASRTFSKHSYLEIIDNLISVNLPLITDKIQMFLLVIPKKGKQKMYPETAHGLAGAYAEEYESTEIAEGEGIKEGDAFKIEEGEIRKV